MSKFDIEKHVFHAPAIGGAFLIGLDQPNDAVELVFEWTVHRGEYLSIKKTDIIACAKALGVTGEDLGE